VTALSDFLQHDLCYEVLESQQENTFKSNTKEEIINTMFYLVVDLNLHYSDFLPLIHISNYLSLDLCVLYTITF